jgi:hypothetical protein
MQRMSARLGRFDLAYGRVSVWVGGGEVKKKGAKKEIAETGFDPVSSGL